LKEDIAGAKRSKQEMMVELWKAYRWKQEYALVTSKFEGKKRANKNT
jgi:hypothetical protein